MKTKVLFLYNDKENDLFAYFPEEHYYHKGHEDYNEMFVCYAHVGQHSSCNKRYADDSRIATEEEYNDLKEELLSIGYELEILNVK